MNINILLTILAFLLCSCAPHITVHVESKNRGDAVVYNEHVCHSPCNVKITIPNKSYCDSSFTIKTVDKTNEMINYFQFIGCEDISLKADSHGFINRIK